MTLHEAILKILEESKIPLSPQVIAHIINERKLYVRGDGNFIPSSQIHARVSKYPQLFSINHGLIFLSKTSLNFFNSERNHTQELEGSSGLHNQKEAISRVPNINSVLNSLDLTQLQQELISTISALDATGKAGCHAATFLFLFRLIALIKDDTIIPPFIQEKDIQYIKIINSSDPFQVNSAILILNKSEHLRGFFNIFLNTIGNQLSIVHNLILGLLSGYDFSNKRYSINEFGESFYNFINKFLVKKNKASAEFSSSVQLVKMFTGLVKNEIKEGDVIYDPAVGFGGFFIDINKSLENKKLKFIGQEINPETAVLCSMNLIMNGIYNSEIHSGNSLVSPIVNASSVNIAISDPPLMRLSNLVQIKELNADYFKIKNTSDLSGFFIQLLNSRVKQNGFMLLSVPNGFLFLHRSANIRKALVKSDLIDYIVDLPSGFLINSQVQISLIAIRQNKPVYAKNRITFFNIQESGSYQFKEPEIESIVKSFPELTDGIINSQSENNYSFVRDIPLGNLKVNRIVVDSDKIEYNNSNLNPKFYFNPVTSILENIDGENEKLLKIKDLIKDERFKVFSNKNHAENNLYKLIRISNLSYKGNDYTLKLERNSKEHSAGEPFGKLINKSVILIAKIGGKLKPTWFEYKGYPIVVSESIIPLVINSSIILPEYFIYQLNSEIVLNQLNIISSGVAMPFFRKSDILEIKIPVPSLSEQINKVAELKSQILQQSRLARFINSINLVEDHDGIKNEMESFSGKYFPQSDQIIFRTELQFDKFPFSHEDISSGKFIISSRDKFLKHMLIQSQEKEIYGVLTVSEEKEIDFEKYDEINAYGNFLFKTIRYIRQSNASNMLAKFAHTSKNLFVSINFEIKSLSETKNQHLKKLLQNELIDEAELIDWKIKEIGGDRADFLAFNKLLNIQTKISRIALFFQKTSTVYKDMMNSKVEEFDLIALIKEADLENVVIISTVLEKISVYAKLNSIKQAMTDLIQNSAQYSTDKICRVNLQEFDNFVSVTIENHVSSESLMTESRYRSLGKDWLTSEHGDGAHAGLYWAFESIQESLGEIKIADYKVYKEQRIFRIELKLRKKI